MHCDSDEISEELEDIEEAADMKGKNEVSLIVLLSHSASSQNLSSYFVSHFFGADHDDYKKRGNVPFSTIHKP